MFGSALLRREGVRGFGFGIGCSGVIQMTWDGRRQVGIGCIGVDTVTVVTGSYETLPVVLCKIPALSFKSDEQLGCSMLVLVASTLGLLVSVGWKAVDDVRGYNR